MATRGSKTEKNDAALPDSVEEQTNIGERNTAGESNLVTIDESLNVEAPPAPVPASGDDPEIVIPDAEPEPEVPEPDDADLISVRGNGRDGEIVFAEVNHRHKGGQVVVLGTDEAKVAPTFRVMASISEGRLIRL